MAFPEPKRSRALLVCWAMAVFAVSAVSDVWVLAALSLLAPALFPRGALRAAKRVLFSAALPSAALGAASWGWVRWVEGRRPELAPYLALGLRTVLIAFLSFSVLARVELFRALAPFPALTRLLVITLAQIHALRLLATESLLGLRSRLLHRPRVVDVVRGAGGITGALFTLSMRNARDVSDAMRSRGF